jgi:hypothetical protein
MPIRAGDRINGRCGNLKGPVVEQVVLRARILLARVSEPIRTPEVLTRIALIRITFYPCDALFDFDRLPISDANNDYLKRLLLSVNVL